MGRLNVTYDGTQHCTAFQEAVQKGVASDAGTAAGGRSEELSPGELVGAGLASSMLFSMGVVALRDGLDITGTRVEVDVSVGRDRMRSVDLAFVMPRSLAPSERYKLERAASMCPIRRSFLPQASLSVRFLYPAYVRN